MVEVEVVNLVAETTREGAVLIRLMEKLERMREALGHDQVYDVISGDGSEEADVPFAIREATGVLLEGDIDNVRGELEGNRLRERNRRRATDDLHGPTNAL